MDLTTTQDKKLAIQQLLATLDPERITKEDFTHAFELVLKRMKELSEQNAAEFDSIHTTLTAFAEKLKADTSTDAEEMKAEISRQLGAANDRFTQLEQGITARLSELQDGIDGEPGEKGDKGDPGDIKQLSPDELRNSLELLQGDDRLDKSAIRGIDQIESKLKEVAARPRGVAPRSNHAMKFYTLTPDGSATQFTVPKSMTGILLTSDFPHILFENGGFTISANRTQITTTTANPISNGAQLIFQYSEVFNT